MMIGTVMASDRAEAKTGGLAVAKKKEDGGFAELLSGQEASADNKTVSSALNKVPGNASCEDDREHAKTDDLHDAEPGLSSLSAPVSPEVKPDSVTAKAAADKEDGSIQSQPAADADSEVDALLHGGVTRQALLKAVQNEKTRPAEAADVVVERPERQLGAASRQGAESDTTASGSDEPAGDWLEHIAHSRRLLQTDGVESGNNLPPEEQAMQSAILENEPALPTPQAGENVVNNGNGLILHRDTQLPLLSNERALSPDRTLSLLGSPEHSAKQLAQEVQVMVSQNLREADIRLNPSELGGLRIQIRMEQGEVQVQFVASHSQARELLDQALPRLKEMMHQQGLNLGQGALGGQQGGFNQNGQQDTRQQSPSAGEVAREGTHVTVTDDNKSLLLLEETQAQSNGRNAVRIDFFA